LLPRSTLVPYTTLFRSTLAISDQKSRGDALIEFAPHLTDDLLVQGLAAAFAISDQEKCAEVLTALVPQLAGTQRNEVLNQALMTDRKSTRLNSSHQIIS